MIDFLTLILLIGGILIVEGRYRQLHGRIKKLEKGNEGNKGRGKEFDTGHSGDTTDDTADCG